MIDDNIKKYIIDIVFNDKVLNSIGKENVGLWLPLVNSKIDNIIFATKNLDAETRGKVLGVMAVKIQRLIIGINSAVRDNYSNGQEAIIKAIIDILIKGQL